MKTITEDLIKTAKYLTRDYTMAEIAVMLDVRVEELRAAISQYETGEWKDLVPEPASACACSHADRGADRTAKEEPLPAAQQAGLPKPHLPVQAGAGKKRGKKK